MTFADFEPEDAWSPGDSVGEQLENLGQRCDLLGEPSTLPRDARPRERIRDIEERLARWRQHIEDADRREIQRAIDIARHLEIVRARI